MILIAFPFYHAMDPWSPILSLNHYSRPYGDRNIHFGSISAFVIFSLPFYYCFVMFLIIVYANQWPINYWQYSPDQAVKQHGCRTWEYLSQWDPNNTIKNKLFNILKRVKSQTGLDILTYKSMYPKGCVSQSFMGSTKSTNQTQG